MLVTVNIKMTHVFKHPNYYKELRKRNKSDQAISPEAHDGERGRAPGPVAGRPLLICGILPAYYASVILYNTLDV